MVDRLSYATWRDAMCSIPDQPFPIDLRMQAIRMLIINYPGHVMRGMPLDVVDWLDMHHTDIGE